MAQYPSDFGGGEIGIEQETGFFLYGFAIALLPQIVAPIRGAAILPDDRAANWLTCFAMPNHGRFTLIGDADRSDILVPECQICSALDEWWRAGFARFPLHHVRPNPVMGNVV